MTSSPHNVKKTTGRVVELDFYRGLAVFFMALQHLAFDLRHVFGLDILAFQDTVIFTDWLRPVIVFLFLVVAGISSSFSKSNAKRGLKLLVLALGLTLTLEIMSFLTKIDLHIYFNVFHVLACGVLLYALLTAKESKIAKAVAQPDLLSLSLILLSMVSLYFGYAILRANPISTNAFLLLGFLSDTYPSMVDYMPLFPWIGFFLGGTAIGRLFYRDKKSIFSLRTQSFMAKCKLIMFLGRHALVFYILHQPIMLGLLWLIFSIIKP